jgi:hypothetical protein
MTLAEYDAWTVEHLPAKIPDPTSPDLRRRVGDSIYDWSSGQPQQRTGVHLDANMKRDLGV